MARIFLFVNLLLLITAEVFGQCTNPPTVTLSSTSGNTCGITPVTVASNTFGGSATAVTITENGGGSVSPVSATISPFTFTYTPVSSDAGKKVTITVTTNNPLGGQCSAARATYTLNVNANPAAPVPGTVTQPTCAVATGSVTLSSLPSTGTWTLTRSPDNVITTGTGTSVLISGITAGAYTYRVTNSLGCISVSSSNIVVQAQPVSPASPQQTVDCSQGFGHAVITVTSPTGTGLTYRLDGGTFQSGVTFSNVANGNHTITVRNSVGCTVTGVSFPVSCGCANPPSLTLRSSSGSTCGTTPLTVSGNTFGGGATSVTITENGSGTVSPASAQTSVFAFTYTPGAGDIGNNVLITVTTNNPSGAPCVAATATFTLAVGEISNVPLVGTITQPSCASVTGSVVLNSLPATGTWIITRLPDGMTTSGTGISTTITGLVAGTYTFTVTSAEGCVSLPSANVIINAAPPIPSAPVVGALAQPTCTVSTGSVMLTGLPSAGNWTLIRSPGGTSTTGSGTSFAISNLTEGTYTYTVTNSVGCISLPSVNIVISAQPTIPSVPVVGTITPPTCVLSTGSVQLTGLPSTGSWTLTRYPGTVTSGGTGSSVIISGLAAGSYNYTLTSAAGCVSLMSANVVIPAQPLTPSPPLIGTITQPHSGQLTGSVVLSGLPEPGTWTLRLFPGNINTSGTGAIHTISELSAGTYSFTVTNSNGCTSGLSASFEINGPTGSHVFVVTNPSPVCVPSTVDLTIPAITAGSSEDLTYTYWLDAAGTIPYYTPTAATGGTYYIKGSATDGFSVIKPVIATVYAIPHANAGPDQILDHIFNVTMDAKLDHNYESGLWSLLSGKGEFYDNSYPKTTVSGLSTGKNLFLWTVTNSACNPVSDSVMINVHDLAFQSLITPNMDGKNDYFMLKRSESDGITELKIFDRRGVQVYKNGNYDNTWNGIDSNGKSLPDDTYFYVFRIGDGTSASGFIVIKR